MFVLFQCGRVGQARFFQDQAYHFQTLRALNDIRTDGADTGEVLETIRHIKEGDSESWFLSWEKLAEQVLKRAEKIQDPMSRGYAFLRAHNYIRTAEFFLSPEDERRLPSFQKGVNLFYKGLDTLEVRYERIKVSYEGKQLNAVYYPGPIGSEKKPLIVLVGGFDSTLEELYFVLVKSAYDRGYSVLTYEGPGQGSAIRTQDLGFTPEWEKPTKSVIDTFLSKHSKPTTMILVGMSLGGYLAPRAAAFDDRFAGVVSYDVLYNFGEVAENAVPGFVLWLRKHKYDGLIEFLVSIKSTFSPSFAWGVKNGRWTMKTASSRETLDAFANYSLETIAPKIKQDVLILAGTEDHFIPLKQVEDFKSKLTNARSLTTVIYDRTSGGAEHCQLGAQTLWQADFFDWMMKFNNVK
ncbi:dipeptidyl aminopeptidase [Leptospira tipperaryensis]|uniref:Dipeptidyl aminopeptidase n=1 Tax=Leptospira tipperaryensis TaxID=2564040 RepID=A0A1D7V2F9_9LEPT|nr:dipeptidyl aminopeptidase [Leptospira tipperaryensis]